MPENAAVASPPPTDKVSLPAIASIVPNPERPPTASVFPPLASLKVPLTTNPEESGRKLFVVAVPSLSCKTAPLLIVVVPA